MGITAASGLRTSCVDRGCDDGENRERRRRRGQEGSTTHTKGSERKTEPSDYSIGFLCSEEVIGVYIQVGTYRRWLRL